MPGVPLLIGHQVVTQSTLRKRIRFALGGSLLSNGKFRGTRSLGSEVQERQPCEHHELIRRRNSGMHADTQAFTFQGAVQSRRLAVGKA
eukprot:1192286-Rhodomonas_salina.2